MICHRRAVAVAMVAAGFSMFAGAASAHADTADERFTDAVSALEIKVAPDTDLPAVGHKVCDMLTSAVVGNVNPVPAVRGVVSTLASNGMNRDQAVGLMRVSAGIYCPKFVRFTGR
ncbi:hypothetical protein NGTWS1803_00430 [Mycolicibacterium cyprinidarum]|nr:hypothetical protein NGTWS1803_00430 [Mycolicibacterium sp. NGTWS1803]